MKKKIEFKVLIYCFIVSLVILFFGSKSSPFYPFNDWVDANAFFTVGKGIFKGIVPYKDIFEQKGPVLYFIFAIASLISNNSFLGVFIIEVLFMTGTLYFIYLICRMFLSKKMSLIVLPIYLVLIVTTASFTHGASCEELMFLPQSISLYYLIRHFKEKELNYKEFFINGLLAGIVLLIKYTSLGFWFAFQFLIFVFYVKDKKVKKGIYSCLYFLLGMVIPFILILIYFGINHGIKDFINVYFIINMTAYGEKVSILKRFIYLFGAFFNSLKVNNIFVIFLVLIYSIIICFLKIKNELKISLLSLYIFTILGVFYGLKSYVYYVLPVNFLIIISLIGISTFIKDRKTNYDKLILVIILIICFGSSYLFSVNRYFHNIKKEDLFQYKFSEIIKEDSRATMVNMGFLDCGVYTMSGLLPNTYFFELQNFDYHNFPDNVDEFKEYINDKKTKYIVYVKKNKKESFLEEEKLKENYSIILEEDFTFENQKFSAYLWKVK